MKRSASQFIAALLVACSQAELPGPCEPFLLELQSVPHATLSVTTGEFVSTWDEEGYRGCEVRFETNDSLRAGTPIPDFDAVRDSDMYGRGWRIREGIRADGPGSGIFGIEKDSVLCIVRWAQPAHIDDRGEIVQSESFSMTVQCRRL